jgi:hypothetical protein
MRDDDEKQLKITIKAGCDMITIIIRININICQPV